MYLYFKFDYCFVIKCSSFVIYCILSMFRLMLHNNNKKLNVKLFFVCVCFIYSFKAVVRAKSLKIYFHSLFLSLLAFMAQSLDFSLPFLNDDGKFISLFTQGCVKWIKDFSFFFLGRHFVNKSFFHYFTVILLLWFLNQSSSL